MITRTLDSNQFISLFLCLSVNIDRDCAVSGNMLPLCPL